MKTTYKNHELFFVVTIFQIFFLSRFFAYYLFLYIFAMMRYTSLKFFLNTLTQIMSVSFFLKDETQCHQVKFADNQVERAPVAFFNLHSLYDDHSVIHQYDDIRNIQLTQISTVLLLLVPCAVKRAHTGPHLLFYQQINDKTYNN